MSDNNPNLNLVKINVMYIQNLVKFYPFFLQILSGNEILSSDINQGP